MAQLSAPGSPQTPWQLTLRFQDWSLRPRRPQGRTTQHGAPQRGSGRGRTRKCWTPPLLLPSSSGCRAVCPHSHPPGDPSVLAAEPQVTAAAWDHPPRLLLQGSMAGLTGSILQYPQSAAGARGGPEASGRAGSGACGALRSGLVPLGRGAASGWQDPQVSQHYGSLGLEASLACMPHLLPVPDSWHPSACPEGWGCWEYWPQGNPTVGFPGGLSSAQTWAAGPSGECPGVALEPARDFPLL